MSAADDYKAAARSYNAVVWILLAALLLDVKRGRLK